MSEDKTYEQPHTPRERKGTEALPMLDHRLEFPAVDDTRSSPLVRRFGRLGLFAVGAYVLLILVLPWQQFVSGSGRVVAPDPLDRVQIIEAPLSGRIVDSQVLEGQQVSAGDVLFIMADNDPQLGANLALQQRAASDRLEAATNRIAILRDQLRAAEAALPRQIQAAERGLDQARAAAEAARLQFDRVQGLLEGPPGGLVSQREFELARLERERTVAALDRADAELQQVRLEGEASLASLRGSLASAQGDSASAAQSLFSVRSQVNTSGSLVVTAPRNGVVFRVNTTEGEFLSAGDPMATIVPDTEERLVELWMDGNDIPLIQERDTLADGRIVQEGSRVRLQFEGWPAVQFIGWPSVARGTFGGEVVLIDPTDDGTGRFRVLVAPRPDTTGDGEVVDWPGTRWLRQGVLANGWVLLGRVPLWYEIWRQLNGFPPALQGDPTMRGGGTGT
jgi:multidrug efflux pump subunit AcrA (membrane-fusion protein)